MFKVNVNNLKLTFNVNTTTTDSAPPNELADSMLDLINDTLKDELGPGIRITRDASTVTVEENVTFVGPSYCQKCGKWPARLNEDKLLLCLECEQRALAEKHPVPLPDSQQALEDLASIGVPGASEKLQLIKSNEQPA